MHMQARPPKDSREARVTGRLATLQGRAKKILLSSVTHVPLGLMDCALAAFD